MEQREFGKQPRGWVTHTSYMTQVGREDGSPVFVILKTETVSVTEIQAPWNRVAQWSGPRSKANISFDPHRMTIFHFESLQQTKEDWELHSKSHIQLSSCISDPWYGKLRAGSLGEKENWEQSVCERGKGSQLGWGVLAVSAAWSISLLLP